MSGDGTRIQGSGLGEYKPFIKIGKNFLVEKTVKSIRPNSITSLTFGIRIDHEQKYSVKSTLKKIWNDCEVVQMGKTRGNLETCLKTLQKASVPKDDPVVFIDCDNPFGKPDILNVCFEGNVDICLLGFRDLEFSNKWCYVNHKNYLVSSVHEKNFAAAGDDPVALIGFFAFQKARHFQDVAEYILSSVPEDTGEHYTSQAIQESLKMGKKVRLLMIDNFVPMGTAEDIKKIL